MPSQMHQKNQETQSVGTQLSSISSISVGWKSVGLKNLEIGGHWQAFCIAGEDLGLDITSQDAADQDQLDRARRPRDTVDKTPTTQTSTPSTS
jgi:hypothetical protein